MSKAHMGAVGMVMTVALMLVGFGAAAQTMIYDVDGLQAMQNDLAGNYVLANDIDASATSTWNGGEGFAPVGTSDLPFTGTFDGAGHTITGLYINRPSTDAVGLFGLTSGVTIQNVGLMNANISGKSGVGILLGNMGSAGGNITNCFSTGTVSGLQVIGGLAGASVSDTITDCYSTANVSGTGFVGGLLGCTFGSTVTNACGAGAVSAVTSYAGGLVGWMSGGAFTNCYSTGAVSGSDSVGGLLGYAWASSMDVTITNGYSTGAVSGTNQVGGLVGSVYSDPNDVIITNSYSTGAVSGTNSVGSLLGYVLNPFNLTLTSTYWDTEISGQSSSPEEGPGACEGKTTSEMLQQATFAGWNFSVIWYICENVSYPFFQLMPSPNLHPVGVTVEQGGAQVDPTNSFPIVFDVVFAAPVTGFDNTDVDFSAGTTAVTAYAVTDSGDGASYTVEVTARSSPPFRRV